MFGMHSYSSVLAGLGLGYVPYVHHMRDLKFKLHGVALLMFTPKKTIIGFILLSLALASQLSNAEIYKYKDENGRWQFTDKKPKSANDDAIEQLSYKKKTTTTENTNTSGWESLAEKLDAKYQPQTPIESATLAVVKVGTIMGVGSGFFVSDSGYIITNKHVVRPKVSTGWKETERELEQEEEYFKRLFRNLKADKANLHAMKEDLKSYKHEVEAPSRYYNPMSKEQYDGYVRRYKAAEKDYKKRRKEAIQKNNEFKQRKTNLTRRSLNSSLAQSFDITFKNNQTAKAHLVKLSSERDIALLKLDGYVTPFLRVSDSAAAPPQGKEVYAIGSPLGQSDSMTRGIVTRVGKNKIITDATILPGNSGGPLVDGDGKLLGVNTQMVTESSNRGGGLGIAIPITEVMSEFGSEFSSIATP